MKAFMKAGSSLCSGIETTVWALACLSMLLSSSTALAGDVHADVVYGTDDRLDLADVSDPEVLRLADSVVALFDSTDLKKSGSSYIVKGLNYQDEHGLCDSEPFLDQPTGAFCSGALVGPDLVLTAAHCIETKKDCTATRFVFGYSIRAAGDDPWKVNASDVFSCKKVLQRVYTEDGADYAVVQLTKKVTAHAPLELDRSGLPIAKGASVGVIGHPNGLPAKVAFGAKVRSSPNDDYFVANLDTFAANSGSPVFDTDTGLIAGVLVRGEEDFVFKNGCRVTHQCAETGCGGEEVTQILNVLGDVPEL